MSERTKQVLIVTAGVVTVVVAGLVYKWFQDRPFETRKCADGTPVEVVRPGPFVIKYSGVSVVASLSRKDDLVGSVRVEENVLQEAIAATQLLDQRLRVVIIEQRATACEPGGRGLLAKVRQYMDVDLVRLREVDREIARLADEKKASGREAAEARLGELATTATNAAAKLQAESR